MMQCKRCGASLLDNSRFCSFCGTALMANQLVLQCSKCKNRVLSTDKFCSQCATPVSVMAAGGVQSASSGAATDVNALQTARFPYMVPVGGGIFVMGDNTVNRKISLSSFTMSATLVTQRQYMYVLNKRPSKLAGENRPVESVNWCEAIMFCNSLSVMHNLKPCYSIGNATDLSGFDVTSAVWKRIVCNFAANGYRLPTEAEWEYAARGGATHAQTQFAGSDDINAVAWYGENSDVTTHDVGTKAPNALGLYDMCGNVAEWCWDYMGELMGQPATNPHGPNIGNMHVKRGGGWLDDPEQCTVFFRSGSAPTGKSSSLGFRVCRTVM